MKDIWKSPVSATRIISVRNSSRRNQNHKVRNVSIWWEKNVASQEEESSEFIGCSSISTKLRHKLSIDRNYWKLYFPCERVFQGPVMPFSLLDSNLGLQWSRHLLPEAQRLPLTKGRKPASDRKLKYCPEMERKDIEINPGIQSACFAITQYSSQWVVPDALCMLDGCKLNFLR